MPDIQDGITEGEQTPEITQDLETDQGFTDRLAEKLGKEAPTLDSPSTDVQSGLTFDEPQPRNERGQFIPKAEAAEGQEPPAAPAEGETPPVEPVEGSGAPPPAEPSEADRLAALEKQLQDAQEMIGRQANEIGQLRQQPPAPVPTPMPMPMITQEVADQVYEFVEKSGFQAAMQWAAANGGPQMMEVVLDAGDALELPEARDFRINLAVEQRLLEREAQQRQQRDPYVQQLEQRDVMTQVVTKVKDDIPDFEVLKPHFEKAIQDGGAVLATLMASNDPQQVEQAVRLAANVARGYAATELAAAAAREAAAKQPAREAMKAAAQVATGSARVTGSGETGDGAVTQQAREEAIAQFKRNIFDAPGTSVADGLTYG